MKLITLIVIAALGLAAQTPPDDAARTRAGAAAAPDRPTVTATAQSAEPAKTEDVAPSVAPVAVQPPPKRNAAASAKATRRQHVFAAVVSIGIAIAWIYGTGH